MDAKEISSIFDSAEIIETHISIVCLLEDKVYKFKKPVDFGFLDFSTLDKRLFYCKEELRLNKRLSPDLYEGLVAITKDHKIKDIDGSDDESEDVLEYGIRMKRMPEDALLSKNPENITPELMHRMVDILLSFYSVVDSDERIHEYGKIESFRKNTDENFQQTEDMRDLISKEDLEMIRRKVESFYSCRYLFEERLSRVFEGHGDLHTGNIFVTDDIYIFDCIEFNERMRNADIACDIAFLCMDLDYLGFSELSRQFLHEFVRRSNDWGILNVMNFYKCYRAYVRGKIEGFQGSAKARKYFGMAKEYARRIHYRYQDFSRPTVIIMCGLPGSGKSYIARWLAAFFDIPVYSTDKERKKMSFEGGRYTRENRDLVYERLFELAEKEIEAGRSCILDGSFIHKEHRSRFENSVIVHPVISDEEAYERLKRRKGNLSDARIKEYEILKKEAEDISADVMVNGTDPLNYEGAYLLLAKKHLK
ncbi:MAG: AAA family ATPase [Candidatus Woesearchaeota archaeon]